MHLVQLIVAQHVLHSLRVEVLAFLCGHCCRCYFKLDCEQRRLKQTVRAQMTSTTSVEICGLFGPGFIAATPALALLSFSVLGSTLGFVLSKACLPE